ncbi:MAG: hypothetical protein IT330_18805 [Anaerolineae bacterium]|nr:hypothetical protein [Anaerolineae bacterium]
MDYKLETARARVEFDAAGQVCALVNKATGNSYVKRQDAAGWRLIFRDDDDFIQVIDAAGQECRVQEVRGGLEFAYPHLRYRGQVLPISLRYRVTVGESAEETIWEYEVTNQSAVEVVEVWFPWISGIEALGGDPAADMLLWPEDSGGRIWNPRRAIREPVPGWLGYSREWRHLRTTYPGRACMQWYGLYNDREGIYLASYDRSLQTTGFNVINEDPGLSFSFVKYPFIKKGETFRSAPFVIALDRSDPDRPGGECWHLGAKRYRRWAATWIRLPEVPKWLPDIDGWHHNIMKQQFGRIHHTYPELYSKIWASARACNLNTLKILGWTKEGLDNLYPEYTADARMGGEGELRAALKKIKEEGGHTFLYTNGALIDPATRFFKEGGDRLTIKNILGVPPKEQYSFYRDGTYLEMQISGGHSFYLACHGTTEWGEVMLAQAKMVMDLGAQGLLYDQIGGRTPVLCFDPTHAHTKPSLAMGPTREANSRRVREYVKDRDSGMAMETEFHVDAYTQNFDLFVSSGVASRWSPGASPAHARFGPAGGGSRLAPDPFPELFCYTFPEPIIMKVHLDTEDPTQLHYAFLYGWKFGFHPVESTGLLASDLPTLAARTRQLIAWRSQYPALLRKGRFIDTDFGHIDNRAILAKGYTDGSRLGIILWNPTTSEQPFRLDVPGRHLTDVLPGGETKLPRSLAANDVVVGIYR